MRFSKEKRWRKKVKKDFDELSRLDEIVAFFKYSVTSIGMRKKNQNH